MQLDFIKQQVQLNAVLTFDQTAILQKALQELHTAMATDPSGTNTVDAIQELEDLAKTIGVMIDSSIESLEENTI